MKTIPLNYCRLLLLVCALFWAAPPDAIGAEQKPKRSKKDEAADKLFSGSEVPRIKIEISAEDVTRLEKYQWRFGPQGERESVKAIVREGDKVYKDVSLHLKGAAGSFRPITENPAMTLNFDKFADGQDFHGLNKLSLNNSVQDPTYISEQFSRELFLKAGVPVPRAGHAVVELNGRDLGIYVLTEGFNKQFLKRHFKNPEGNLYDGGFLKDVTQELALNSGDNPKDQSDRIALAEAAAEPDLAKRLTRLQKTLDLDKFLTYIALDVMLWDWDGYAQNKNNWRLFQDRSTGKLVFIPHGLDQLFWKPEGPIFPPMQGMVAKAALQIPELRTRYVEEMKKLRGTVYNTQAMTNRVRAIAAKIAPILKEKNPDRVEDHENAVAAFCDSIVRRGRSIDEQIAHPIVPLKFDESGAAVLARWESKTNFGHPKMARQSGAGGNETLQVSVLSGSSIGTWASKFWLDPGRYKVEGEVKTHGIVADLGDSRGGAGLRLANARPDEYLLADSDWKPVSREFSVDDVVNEVQILCELRGVSGEASFQSIRLRRLGNSK